MSEERRDYGRGKPDSTTHRHEPNENSRNSNNPTYGERKGGFGKGGENTTDPNARMRGDRREAFRNKEEREAAREKENEDLRNQVKGEIDEINVKNQEVLNYAAYLEEHEQYKVAGPIAVKIEKHEKIPADLLDLLVRRRPKRKEHILDGCVIKPE